MLKCTEASLFESFVCHPRLNPFLSKFIEEKKNIKKYVYDSQMVFFSDNKCDKIIFKTPASMQCILLTNMSLVFF